MSLRLYVDCVFLLLAIAMLWNGGMGGEAMGGEAMGGGQKRLFEAWSRDNQGVGEGYVAEEY